jgi:hypothetical protein
MGSKAPTTSSSTAAPAWLQQNLQDVQSRAQGVASTPYQAYGGQLTESLNQTQQTGINGITGAIGASVPYYQEGSGQVRAGFDTTANAGNYYQQGASGLGSALPYFQQGASSINGAQPYYSQASDYSRKAAGPLDINSYLNPYQQSVIDTTMAQQQRQDSIAQNGALSTAIQTGNAFGGDRMGVAAAQLASDQSRNRASTLAGLNSANYSQALSAAQADAARYGNTATQMAGLGNAQLQAGLGYNTIGNSQVQAGLGYGQLGNGVTNQGATLANQGTAQAALGQNYQNGVINANNSALAAGTVSQQTDQAGLNAAYQQYLNQTGFPYQQTSWLSNIINGGSGAAGGTTTSTGPAPNVGSQILGGGLALGSLSSSSLGGAALMAMMNRGGVVPARASGGSVSIGSMFPMAGGPIDMTGTPGGSGLIPQIQFTQARLNAPAAIDPNKGQGGSQDMSKGLAGLSNGWLGQSRPTYGGATSSMGDPTGIGGLYASGGVVPRGYADGGVPNFDDRWAPVNDALGNFTFQPGQMVSPGLVPSAPPPQPSTPLGPTDPNAAPFRLDGSYRDQPENIAPLNETQAASRFAGNDEPVAGLGLPPEIARGMSRPVPQQDSPVMAYDAPRGLVPPAYAPQPTGVVPQSANGAPSDSLVGKLFGVGDDGRQAMLSLGLGLLANRSPNFGVALGEAGLGAVGSYNQIQKDRTSQAEKDRDFGLQQRRVEMEAQRLQQQVEETKRAMATGDLIQDPKTGRLVPNPAKLQFLKSKKELEEDNIKPGIVGYNEDGTPITGFIDSTHKKYILPGGKEYTPPSSAPTANSGQSPASENIDGAAPFNYSRVAPTVSKGMDVPPPAPISGRSPETIQAEAEYYLQTGQLKTPAPRSSSVNAIQQQNYRNSVVNFANTLAASRGMTPSEVSEGWRTAPSMTKFILGPDGRSTVALGTATRHLDTLDQYIDAYSGNNQPGIRKFGAMLDKQFGLHGATDINAISAIVGPEIVKAIGVAGAGTADERGNFEHMFQQGTGQAKGAITAIKTLLNGQLEGKERQAKEAGVSSDRFKRLIGEQEYNKIKHLGGIGSAASAKRGVSADDQKALDWANTNASDPRASKIKQRLGVEQ